MSKRRTGQDSECAEQQQGDYFTGGKEMFDANLAAKLLLLIKSLSFAGSGLVCERSPGDKDTDTRVVLVHSQDPVWSHWNRLCNYVPMEEGRQWKQYTYTMSQRRRRSGREERNEAKNEGEKDSLSADEMRKRLSLIETALTASRQQQKLLFLYSCFDQTATSITSQPLSHSLCTVREDRCVCLREKLALGFRQTENLTNYFILILLRDKNTRRTE